MQHKSRPTTSRLPDAKTTSQAGESASRRTGRRVACWIGVWGLLLAWGGVPVQAGVVHEFSAGFSTETSVAESIDVSRVDWTVAVDEGVSDTPRESPAADHVAWPGTGEADGTTASTTSNGSSMGPMAAAEGWRRPGEIQAASGWTRLARALRNANPSPRGLLDPPKHQGVHP